MRVLFLYLTSFSTHGGIEKFNKAFMKAMSETDEGNLTAFSTHDSRCDSRYISSDNFKGFSGNKISFAVEAVSASSEYDTIVLGHINLAPVGVLIKKLYPHKKLILVAHGIEVWNKLNGLKKKLLNVVDEIIAVSNFTKNKLINNQDINANKVKIINNTIDPYFDFGFNKSQLNDLRSKYQIDKSSKVILTVCRISSKEKYKGYDKVIDALPQVLKIFSDVKYILVGKCDEQEKNRINKKILQLNLNNNVILTGFIPESELSSYYLLADVFAMPSRGEGFGIVFLEAMACGLPVLTGNNDGSREILEKINYGISVEPDNPEDVISAIISLLNQKMSDENINQKVQRIFGYEKFKISLQKLLYLEQKVEAEA